MRDVSHKPHSLRTATAEALLQCAPATLEAIRSGNVPKADPLATARVAGIQAAKNTSLLIPYCHPVPVDYVGVEISMGPDTLHVTTSVKAVWKTGVEMEALTAAAAAALTLYDMLKIIDDTMEIRFIKLTAKSGGNSDAGMHPGEGIAAGVMVLSDEGSRGRRQDTSGRAIKERLEALDVAVTKYSVLPDERNRMESELRLWADELKLDLILTTGGTGVGKRDVTPEATRSIVDRELPGIVETLRAHGQERNRHAMLSRGIAGVRGKTIIVNLPGSTPAVKESLDVLLPWVFHALSVIRGEGHDAAP